MAAAAREGHPLIETPCWVQGAETADDLATVHVWNEMRHLSNETHTGDHETNKAITAHLTAVCLGLRPRTMLR